MDLAATVDAEPTYFDHNATTPMDPRVRAAMLPWLDVHHGNPSSAHACGRRAHQAMDAARSQVAGLIGADAGDVVFTATGSEANSMVIHAVAEAHDYRGHIVYGSIEHPSVRVASERLARGGIETTELRPGAEGLISPDAVADALRDDTLLVCVMQANNELGTIQPVAEISALCRERGIPVLCDAVQAVGKIPVDVADLGVTYLTLGGHKFHGPLGAAALWVAPGAPLSPIVYGAAQEHGLRAGTENVPALVGLGECADLARLELDDRHRHLLSLRTRFEDGLAALGDTVVHCADSPRLPHTTHVAFLGVSGHDLMLWLDGQGFAVSTGSACHSGQPQPSRVLLHMGTSEAEARASLRVSFGVPNTPEEVDAFLNALAAGLPELRAGSLQHA
ncbi:MAG: cysteine desulfurase family protein [Acidobacteriota bacterium]